VDEIRLAADDEAAPTFDITWSDVAHEPGTTVTIGIDGNRRGFNGRTVASGIPQQGGTNTYRLDARDLMPGTYWVWVKASDGTSTTSTYATGPLRISERIAGSDRVATSVALSQAAYPQGATVAAVAPADNFADALAGAQLAAAADAPILLTGKDGLDARVADELRRLQVDTVYVLGGPASLSSQVQQDIEALPGVTATRLSGTQRELTAVAIAEEAVALWEAAGVDVGDVLLARAFDFPDALSAGQLVAAARSPLLLIPRDTAAPAAVAAFIDDLDPDRVVAVGGPASVPSARIEAVAGGRPTSRIDGPDRHATAVAVRAAAMAAGVDGAQVMIASGRTFPDALAAAGLVAARGGTLLTSDAAVLPGSTNDALRAGTVVWYRLAGGPATLTGDVAAQVADAVG
jgi:putative cell wall-binding protein